jgi:hypothetical protein
MNCNWAISPPFTGGRWGPSPYRFRVAFGPMSRVRGLGPQCSMAALPGPKEGCHLDMGEKTKSILQNDGKNCSRSVGVFSFSAKSCKNHLPSGNQTWFAGKSSI